MQKGRVRRKMIWILCSVAALVLGVIVFFQIPYSVMRNDFQRDVQRHIEQSNIQDGIFTEQNLVRLPELVQSHFRAAGLIGQPIMTSATAMMSSATLRESNDRPPMIIDYTLYLFAYSPVRLAYIKTSMFGIPFEGYDSLQDGEGFMRGVIGKIFTLFNQTGNEMDRAQLLTYLGECFMIPSSVFGEHITWETIDETSVRATITYGGISLSGLFVFGDNGLVQSFHTTERARIGNDGSVDFPGWSAVYEDWRRGENGIYMPNSVRAIWHESGGDLVYFEASNIDFAFN